MAAKITPEIRTALKGAGILSNRDMEHFSIRIITENGVLNAQQVAALTEVARRYGDGSIAMTGPHDVGTGRVSLRKFSQRP